MEATAMNATACNLEPTSKVVMITAGNVSWPPASEAERSRDEAFARSLAQSIGMEGLHHPILVKELEGQPGRYEGVSGWHRHHAVAVVLGRPEIEAKILSGRQLKLARMIIHSENVFRNPLNKAQEILAMKQWRECYDAQRQEYFALHADGQAGPNMEEAPDPDPEYPGPTEDGGLAPEGARQVGGPAIGPPEPPPASFVRHVAEATGKSTRSIERQLGIARKFTDDQLEVFTREGTPQSWMETIAGLEPDERDEAVKGVASGKGPSEAVAVATGKPREAPASESVATLANPPDAEGPNSKMSDARWLDFHCSELMASLHHPERFRADAIFYRRNIDLLLSPQAKVRRNAFKQPGVISLGYDSFFSRVMRIFGVAHPRLWRRCEACQGSGVVPQDAKKKPMPCRGCSGGGYLVTQHGPVPER